jgi:hypothetical protein
LLISRAEDSAIDQSNMPISHLEIETTLVTLEDGRSSALV